MTSEDLVYSVQVVWTAFMRLLWCCCDLLEAWTPQSLFIAIAWENCLYFVLFFRL